MVSEISNSTVASNIVQGKGKDKTKLSKNTSCLISIGAFSSIEEIPESIVHDHDKNGLPRLSSFSDSEIQKR